MSYTSSAVDIQGIVKSVEAVCDFVDEHKNRKKVDKKTKKLKKKKDIVQQDKEKAERIQQAREKQYTKLEQLKVKKEESHDEERNRLTEAMILSEVIGMPRCKSRRSRGYGRRYGS